ncbi:hypothetical protein [Rhodobacter maris]|uniref:Peptidoglycan binding protein n=1 Tax=Rhodobacter maris TaxID=446682 RepID=A0A285SE25_9RHOB|nr:hypothetical protein [Rhodobacter maris]SOC05748.1 hypothetical protein SAMN05877831_104205 [Rhodobacter maris]
MFRSFLYAGCLAAAVFSAPALAFDMSELADPFDAGRLSATELRFLQSMIAFEGSYDGMIDGKWGPASQAALEKFMANMGLPGVPMTAMVLLRAAEHQIRFENDGWHETYLDAYGFSLLTPMQITPIELRGPSFGFSAKFYPIVYTFEQSDRSQLVGTHDQLLASAKPGTPSYRLRRADRKVTAVLARNDRGLGLSGDVSETIFYLRSERSPRGWNTLLLMTGAENRGLMAMVAGSVVPGEGAPIELPETGEIVQGIRAGTAAGLFGRFDANGNLMPLPGAQAPALLDGPCRSWGEEVTVSGPVRKQIFPGPPNYENIALGDAEEVATILTLDEPFCLNATPGDPEEIAVRKITEMQLVSPIPASSEPVTVTGMPFLGHTGHHHTEVMLGNRID